MLVNRRALLAGALAASACRTEGREGDATPPLPARSAPRRMPVLFLGHGSPLNAIEDNTWSRAFKQLGQGLPAARAVLCISAHWYGEGTRVTGNDPPPTLHDFSGFPEALSRVSYPARGDLPLAERVTKWVPGARLTYDWGLDHGAWSVLCHLRPRADCPVLQLSIDARLSGAEHLAIGRAIAPLRDEGVLIVGSGNIVHNLRDALGRLRRGDSQTPEWARRFDEDAAKALAQHDRAWLAQAPVDAPGRAAHPSPDHYLPLLYAAGAADERDVVSFPVVGFDAGSLSMRAVRYDSPS